MANPRKRHPRPKNTPPLSENQIIYRAFTLKYNGLTNRLITNVGITPFFDPKPFPSDPPFPILEKQALWDTGATDSVITSATVQELNLTPIGVATINHAGGTSQNKTYLVNFFLPNKVGIAGVRVSECPNITGDFGVIIGMDIISKGDLALTNANNQTCLSFRIPSIQPIDFVEEFNAKYKPLIIP